MVNEKRAVRLLQDLVRINSENPPDDCRKIAAFVRKQMESAGLSVKTYEYRKGAPVLVGTLRGVGKGRRASLLLVPHMDTVPAGSGWKHDPFRAEIINGRMYGRGVQDCKIHVAACIEAARCIVESGVKLEGDLVVAVIPDEETGSRSLAPLVKKRVLDTDCVIVTDHWDFDVVAAQKGLIHMRITVFGKKAHGAYPWLGDSAIDRAAAIVSDLKKLKFRYKKSARYHGPTINVGTIRGGETVNTVASRCEIGVDLRYLPGMGYSRIMTRVAATVSSHAKKYEIVVDDHQAPFASDTRLPYVRTLLSCIRKRRKSARIVGTDGVTAISFFKKRNAVCVGFGPAGVAHMTDEYILVSNLMDGTSVLEDFVEAYLRVAKTSKR
jgi:succinyl-diaminopimelate desuccinylase